MTSEPDRRHGLPECPLVLLTSEMVGVLRWPLLFAGPLDDVADGAPPPREVGGVRTAFDPARCGPSGLVEHTQIELRTIARRLGGFADAHGSLGERVRSVLTAFEQELDAAPELLGTSDRSLVIIWGERIEAALAAAEAHLSAELDAQFEAQPRDHRAIAGLREAVNRIRRLHHRVRLAGILLAAPSLAHEVPAPMPADHPSPDPG